jgi:hypothetical protein
MTPPNSLDGGTGIYANLTNSTEDSYSQISTQGLARIASLVLWHGITVTYFGIMLPRP